MHAHRFHRSALALIALTGVFATASAGALADPQDLRSPDTRDAALAATNTPDLRSPDARDAALTVTTGQDLRSPDTRTPQSKARWPPSSFRTPAGCGRSRTWSRCLPAGSIGWPP